MLPLPIKLKKPLYVPIFRLFCPKNPKARILSKWFYPIFSRWAAITLRKISEKFSSSICYETRKNSPWAQHKTFHKKYYLNQFEAFSLLKPEKPHVGAILRTLWPENLKTRFFPKKIALVNFKSLLL